jgi:hypothetical protein
VELYGQGKTEELRKENCPRAILTTTIPTWTGPGVNQGLRGERPATNRLSLKYNVTARGTYSYRSALKG